MSVVGSSPVIRPASAVDWPAIWAVLEPTIRGGETYALPTDMGEAGALAYWTGWGRVIFVAEQEGRVAGTYYLRANHEGGGDHVANCGYVTDPALRGRGIARLMAEHSLDEARRRGFLAMQFNFVVGTNESAVHLWQRLGFETVGRLPGAFRHPRLGLVDALVMFRTL